MNKETILQSSEACFKFHQEKALAYADWLIREATSLKLDIAEEKTDRLVNWDRAVSAKNLCEQVIYHTNQARLEQQRILTVKSLEAD